MHQPLRHLTGGGQDEGEWAGDSCLDRPERGIAQVHQRTELGEVAAHQREVVLVVEATQLLDPFEPVPVAQLDAERVAGVRGIGDESAVSQDVHHLRDGPRLRVDRVYVEVARHGLASLGAGLGAGLGTGLGTGLGRGRSAHVAT